MNTLSDKLGRRRKMRSSPTLIEDNSKMEPGLVDKHQTHLERFKHCTGNVRLKQDRLFVEGIIPIRQYLDTLRLVEIQPPDLILLNFLTG